MLSFLQESDLGDLWRLSATEVVQLLKIGKVTAQQLIDISEQRWKATEPAINATPIQCFDRARKAAAALVIPDKPGPGYLYGLPIVVKDTAAVKGVVHTQGSILFKDRIALDNDPQVEILEKNGGIVVGKTNVPEFGAGANTYNQVFGETRNPWDTRTTSGGSSGGTAAALAAGQVWLGTGADLGGSLRIPASFCGIVGFRASVGRVAQQYQGPMAVDAISGPMARNVADLSLMLDAMSGKHPRDPMSLPAPETPFSEVIREGVLPLPTRVAYSKDLGGTCPVNPEVAAICERGAQVFQALGASLANECPDLADAANIFQVLRAHEFKEMAALMSDEKAWSLLKPELHWQIRKGASQTAEQVEEAREALKALRHRVHKFMANFDLFCSPCVMVPPFDVKVRWLTDVEGQKFDNYVDWLRHTYTFSLVNVPVISLPCGLTEGGLPVGLQVVGKHGSDAALLAAAAAFERTHSFKSGTPIDPRRAT